MVLAPAGQVTALFLFDVAEGIRLADARALLGLAGGARQRHSSNGRRPEAASTPQHRRFHALSAWTKRLAV